MKVSHLRKELKNSSVTVKLTSFSYSGDCAGLSAIILVDLKNAAVDARIPPLSAQCNDFSRNGEFTSSRKEAKNQFRTLPKYTGFYAVKCTTEMSLFRDWNDSVPAIASLFSLVRSEIENKNLSHVSDCELTQFLSALENLGCKLVDVQVNGGNFPAWLQSRKNTIAALSETL